MSVGHAVAVVRLIVVVLAAGMAHAAEPLPVAPQSMRLELAAGIHERVVPERVSAERSTWLAIGDTIDRSTVIEIATSDIVRWGLCPPWPQGPMVLLADGGVIAGRIVALDGRTCVVESVSIGRLELPAAAVRGYRSSLATGPAAVEPGDALAGKHPGVVLLANGDRVTAARIGWQGDTLTVETGRGAVAIAAGVVRAVDFSVPAPTSADALPAPRISVAVADGSRFAITGLQPAAAVASFARTTLSLRPAGGDDRPLMAECAADAITALVVDGGRATFLAAREPTEYQREQALGPAWPPARGHALTGDWPGLRGETAFTAVGLHAPARVRYRLERPAERFEAMVGLDDSAGQGGSAIVRVVTLDEASAPREVYASRVLRGGEPPLAIRAELGGATSIELVVDPADDGEVLDRTLWLDPRIIGAAADVPATR